MKTGVTFYSILILFGGAPPSLWCGTKACIFRGDLGMESTLCSFHTVVHDKFGVTTVIYKEVFGFIIPSYVLVRRRGLTYTVHDYMKYRLETG